MSNLATSATTGSCSHRTVQSRPLGRIASTEDELDDLSTRVAGGLRAHGVRPGDRVELALPRGSAFTVISRGARRVGATIVVADPEHRIDHPDTRVAFAWHNQEAAHSQSSSTFTVPVGPDFLNQLLFWPTSA
ncbi:non-ribosomal peptide synthetase component F [Streptacidiphilus sp. MAP12-33]|uniref:AMP-binding protein n=1 Tax=Streptacidiphilus sp. MAP12-33 TaxID=3156266 RepID=UPI003511AC3B